jgi:protoheme IX farnesyltransferase
MVGWAAVTGDVGIPSLVLFAIIFMWTPPHFWALSLYRSRDYALAGVPMLPVVAGPETTRTHILAYTLVLLPISLLPVALGFAGLAYGAIALFFSLGFVGFAVRLWRDRTQRTATRTFRFSILYLFAVLAGLVVDRALSLAGVGLPAGVIW